MKIFKACVSDTKFFVVLTYLIERRVAETG